MSSGLPSHESTVPRLGERDAFEWGLAAIAISAVLITTSPIVLILAVQMWSSSCHDSGPVLLHAWLARLGVAIVMALAGTALVFAITAANCAVSRKQSVGLAAGAIALSTVAIAAWIITAIGLLQTTESLLRIYGP